MEFISIGGIPMMNTCMKTWDTYTFSLLLLADVYALHICIEMKSCNYKFYILYNIMQMKYIGILI